MNETKVPVGPVLPSGSQQLLIWRDITRRTGMLQEMQALNLRVWPLGFLGLKTNTTKYDHKNLTVEFSIGEFDGSKPDDFETRLLYLDAAVKFLLGTDVIVVVKKGDATLYEGLAKTEEEWLSMTLVPQRKKSTRTGKKTKTNPR